MSHGLIERLQSGKCGRAVLGRFAEMLEQFPVSGPPRFREACPQLLGKILAEQWVRVDGRGWRRCDINQAQISKSAQDATPAGRRQVLKRGDQGAQLCVGCLAQNVQQLLLGWTVEESQQTQNSHFCAGLLQVLYIGPKQMPRVAEVLLILFEQRNLVAAADLPVIRGVAQV